MQQRKIKEKEIESCVCVFATTYHYLSIFKQFYQHQKFSLWVRASDDNFTQMCFKISPRMKIKFNNILNFSELLMPSAPHYNPEKMSPRSIQICQIFLMKWSSFLNSPRSWSCLVEGDAESCCVYDKHKIIFATIAWNHSLHV